MTEMSQQTKNSFQQKRSRFLRASRTFPLPPIKVQLRDTRIETRSPIGTEESKTTRPTLVHLPRGSRFTPREIKACDVTEKFGVVCFQQQLFVSSTASTNQSLPETPCQSTAQPQWKRASDVTKDNALSQAKLWNRRPGNTGWLKAEQKILVDGVEAENLDSHKHSLRGRASCTNNTTVFNFSWTKSFWIRNQKGFYYWSRSWSQKLQMPGPGIRAGVPQSWSQGSMWGLKASQGFSISVMLQFRYMHKTFGIIFFLYSCIVRHNKSPGEMARGRNRWTLSPHFIKIRYEAFRGALW